MPKVISIVSTKGGVGKTTATANLAAYFADQGLKTLMIDADVQPSLSKYYSIQHLSPLGLQALMTDPHFNIDDVVSKIEPNLDIIVSDDPHAELQEWVKNTPDGRFRLRKILRQRFDDYDVILIDTQGAVGALQEATVIASDMMLSPVMPDKVSASEFIQNTVAMINRVSESAGFLDIKVGSLVTVINGINDTSVCQDYADEIREADYSQNCQVPVHVLKTAIPHTVAFREAASRQMPAHRFEPSSKRKSGSALDVIRDLASEIDLV